MLITEKGMIIRLNTTDISTIGRNTQGVRLIQLDEGDHLVSVARLAEREGRGGEPAGRSQPRQRGGSSVGSDEKARGQADPFAATTGRGTTRKEDGMNKRGALSRRPGDGGGLRPPADTRHGSSTSTSAPSGGDNQTLTSFAMVQFDQKVDNWKVTG